MGVSGVFGIVLTLRMLFSWPCLDITTHICARNYIVCISQIKYLMLHVHVFFVIRNY